MEPNNRGSFTGKLGFVLSAAGASVGLGNIWRFPYLAAQYGGGIFVLIYLIFLVIMGVPVMTMEFSLGRASQASPIGMYQKLEKDGQKWHIHGKLALFGNVCLMAFYTVVTGWMIHASLAMAV